MQNKVDLLNFTENPYYYSMIHDKGFSFAALKSLLNLIILPLSMLFFTERCSNPSTFNHSDNISLFLILMLIASAYYTQRNINPLIKKFKSKSWEKTIADINKIEISKIKVAYKTGVSIEYVPALTYSYNINGTKYQSDILSFEAEEVYNFSLDDQTSNRYHDMNNLFSTWVEERKLEVYYNPEMFKESVVFREFHPLRHFFYIVLGLFSAIALIFSIYNIICYVYWVI